MTPLDALVYLLTQRDEGALGELSSTHPLSQLAVLGHALIAQGFPCRLMEQSVYQQTARRGPVPMAPMLALDLNPADELAPLLVGVNGEVGADAIRQARLRVAMQAGVGDEFDPTGHWKTPMMGIDVVCALQTSEWQKEPLFPTWLAAASAALQAKLLDAASLPSPRRAKVRL